MTEICIGVTVSSVFSSLLEPSYRATVSDLLDEEEYSRASGMVSLAGSATLGVGETVCAAGFLFFAMLPFANNCLDYLVRTNIADELQGRAWGLIGFLSQIGYVVAYGLAGNLADMIGERTGIGVGRGAAVVIMASGVLLAGIALSVSRIRAVRELER